MLCPILWAVHGAGGTLSPRALPATKQKPTGKHAHACFVSAQSRYGIWVTGARVSRGVIVNTKKRTERGQPDGFRNGGSTVAIHRQSDRTH